MLRRGFIFAALAVTLLAVALAPSSAGAQPIYSFDVRIDVNNASSTLHLRGLDSAKKTTVRVTRLGVQQVRTDASAGATSIYVSTGPGLQLGDVIEIYQLVSPGPALPEPPLVPPNETFVVPAFTVAGVAGATSITGNAPDDATVYAMHWGSCGLESDARAASRGPGVYGAAFPVAIAAGTQIAAKMTEPDGDKLEIDTRVPGETPCIDVDMHDGDLAQIDSKPFSVEARYLYDNTIPTTRLVLRRAGAEIASANDDDLDLTRDLKPQPGDVVELYRPKDAATPVVTLAVPPVNGIVDAGNDMAAVDAPAARVIAVEACRFFNCAGSTDRVANDTPAGRTLFNFAQSQGWNRALDLLPDDQYSGEWESQDGRLNVEFDLLPGDLTAPAGVLTLAKIFNLRKIGRRIKFRINASEPSSAVSKLTVTPNLPGNGGKAAVAARRKAKTYTLASTKSNLVAGVNSVSMKVSRKGKKLIQRMSAYGKRQTAVLTVTMTDPAGNVTTVVKNTKLTVKRPRKKSRR